MNPTQIQCYQLLRAATITDNATNELFTVTIPPTFSYDDYCTQLEQHLHLPPEWTHKEKHRFVHRNGSARIVGFRMGNMLQYSCFGQYFPFSDLVEFIYRVRAADAMVTQGRLETLFELQLDVMTFSFCGRNKTFFDTYGYPQDRIQECVKHIERLEPGSETFEDEEDLWEWAATHDYLPETVIVPSEMNPCLTQGMIDHPYLLHTFMCIPTPRHIHNQIMSYYFVSSSPDKHRELCEGVKVAHPTIDVQRIHVKDLPEIQGTSEEIASEKAKAAIKAVPAGPCYVIVEDVALHVDALDGNPGVNIKSYMKMPKGKFHNIVKSAATYELKEGEEPNMNALMVCVYAVAKRDEQGVITVQCFRGEQAGVIVEDAGTNGFGFDFYFAPKGQKRTYAEMDLGEKLEHSARQKAIEQLVFE